MNVSLALGAALLSVAACAQAVTDEGVLGSGDDSGGGGSLLSGDGSSSEGGGSWGADDSATYDTGGQTDDSS